MLYPNELSSGDVPDSNRRNQRWLMPNLSAIVVRGTSSPGLRHTPRQCRAHRTGFENPYRCRPFERCSALTPRRRRQSVCACIPLPPVPKHPGTTREASSRFSLPRASKSPDASGARCNRDKGNSGNPLRTPEMKNPRMVSPRAFAFLGDRGDRSPRCRRISRWWGCRNNPACCIRAAARRAVRTRAGPHRAWAMEAVQRCGRRGSWSDFVRVTCAGCAKVAHLTDALRKLQEEFSSMDERQVSMA